MVRHDDEFMKDYSRKFFRQLPPKGFHHSARGALHDFCTHDIAEQLSLAFHANSDEIQAGGRVIVFR